MSFELITSSSITGTRAGRPDYSQEVDRGKSVWGYTLSEDETFLFPLMIAYAGGGNASYAFTREPIPSGTTVEMIEAISGNTGIIAPAGYDYLLKEIWISFNQPVRFEMFQQSVQDYSCFCYVPAYPVPPWSGLPIGWTRAQVESIAPQSTTNIRILNLGASPASGKAWIVGFQKEGAYTWY